MVMIDPHQWDREVERRGRAADMARFSGREEFTTRRVQVATTAPMKAAVYSALRLLIDAGQLLIPADAEELRRELLMLRVDLSASGTERIEASSGHDDLADALALSLGPWRSRDGRWRTVIADLADRDSPPVRPDALLAGLQAGEMVATGSGTRLPRLAAVQSVRGAQVTVPAGRVRRKVAASPTAAALERALLIINEKRTV